MFEELLEENEVAEKLDPGGWIVLRNLLGKGDEIIITDWAENGQPLRTRVWGISSVNTIATELQDGWLDVMWNTYLIRRTDVVLRPVTIASHLKNGPYHLMLEKENEWNMFGWAEDDLAYRRVYPKKIWSVLSYE